MNKNIEKAIVSGLIAVFVMSLLAGLMPYDMVQLASAAGSIKAPIHINNTAGGALSYYQVNLNVTYDSDMNNDFSDIRVKNETAGVSVPYWIEDKVDGSYANIWFKGNVSSGWDNNTHALYYGDAGASSASNGTNTFEFFDDFLGSSIDTNKWEGATGQTSVANSIATLTRVGTDVVTSKGYTVGRSTACRFRSNHAAVNYNMIGYVVNSLDNPMFVVLQSSFHSGLCAQACGDTCQHIDDIATTGVYHTFEIQRKSGTSNEFFVDGASKGSLAEGNSTALPISFAAYSNAQDLLCDWILVRKYTTPEPTASLGAEEHPLYYSTSGYVKTSGGIAIENAYVYNNVTSETNYTNVSGYYILPVANGTYSISARKSTYTTNSIIVTVSGVNITNQNITLTSCSIPPTPTNLQHTSGIAWVNYTWGAGSGNVTDSYNVSLNNVWTNGTTNTFMNTTNLCSGLWANITVYAFNNTGYECLSVSSVSDHQQTSSPAWVDSNYDYRVLICVQNITTNNYQIKTKIHSGSGTNNATDIFLNNHNATTTFNDIRFYDQMGSALSYWIEDNTTDPAVLWYNTTENGTVQLYYGYAGASYGCDGTTTFEFFDDFLGTLNSTYKMINYVETVGNKYADQSVGYDGTYFYTVGDNIATDETLNKYYASNWTLVSSRDCSGDAPAGRTQLCQIYYNSSDNRLYISGGSYPGSSSYVSVYFTNLTEDTYHTVDSGHAEGVFFAKGHWWTANFGNNNVYQYNTSWSLVGTHIISVPGIADSAIHNEAGIWWLGDYFYYGTSYGIYTYYWNGTGFDFIETQASFGDQGICFNEGKTQAWWAYSHNDVVNKFEVLDYVYEEDLSKWDKTGDRPIGTNNLDGTTLVIGTAEPNNTIKSKSYTVNGDVALKTRMKFYGYTSIDFGFSGGENADSALLEATGKETEQYKLFVSDGVSSSGSSGINMDTTNYHNYEITWNLSKVALLKDNVEEASLTTNLPNDPMEIRIGVLTTNYHQTAWFDWTFVRKYVTPEPTTQLGAEQTAEESDCTTPVISSLTNSTPGTTNVTITWSTNQSADNRVKYSKNSDLSNELWSSWDNDTTSISIDLTSLDSGTPYYYQATSYNGTNSSCVITEPVSSPYKNFTTQSTSGEVEITLATGWNIFGYTNSTTTDASGIADKIGSNCSYVTERNKTSGNYVNFNPAAPDENNFAVEHGWGYYVSVSGDTNLTMTASTGSYEITLVDGWCIFGWTNTTTGTANYVATDIGSNCSYVTERNKTTGNYVNHNPAAPDENNFAVERGWGYYTYLTAETVWNRTA